MRLAKVKLIIKYLFFIASLFAVLFILFKNLDEIILLFTQELNLLYILITVLLMFLNYFLESVKFRVIISDLIKLPYSASFKSILAGTSVSILTPNRAFNFLGRLIYIPDYLKPIVVVKNWVINLTQSLITILFGLFFGLSLLNKDTPFEFKIGTLFIGASLTLCILFILFKWNKKIRRKVFKAIKSVTLNQLLSSTLLSLLRYIVFVLQYFFLINALGYSITILQTFYSLSALFFMLFLFPFSSFGQIGTREIAMLFVFQMLSESLIVSVGLLIWLINVVSPAILGAFVFLDKKSA